MATIFSEDFESGSSGAAITTSNTSFSFVQPGSGSTFSTTPAPTPSGSQVAKMSTGATADNRQLAKAYTAVSAVYIRAYFYVPAFPSTSLFLFQHSGASTLRAGLRLDTGGTLTLRNAAIAIYTSTNTIPLGAWFRVEHRVDNVASQQEFRVFIGANVNGTTADWASGVQTYNQGTIDNTGIWPANAVANYTLYTDAVQADSATWPGPVLAVVRTGKAKVWTGGAWASHPVKTWNGSAWVMHPTKGWDGSQWTIGK